MWKKVSVGVHCPPVLVPSNSPPQPVVEVSVYITVLYLLWDTTLYVLEIESTHHCRSSILDWDKVIKYESSMYPDDS